MSHYVNEAQSGCRKIQLNFLNMFKNSHKLKLNLLHTRFIFHISRNII